jgi:hypothetical protein
VEDPLIVEREELLQLIEELERLCAGLQDVNAGVSSRTIKRLRRLRAEVARSRSPTKWNHAWTIALEIIRAVAPELVKLWIETLTYELAARFARRHPYEVWSVPEIPTRLEWAHAA